MSHRLAPHESPDTDLILLGHSMGGILAAEVTLLPPLFYPSYHFFRHRVLGTINFDTPFLGMHPGVIVSGIGSLFRPAQEPPSAAKRSSRDDDGLARPASSEEPFTGTSATAPSSLYATESRSLTDITSQSWETRSAPPEPSLENLNSVYAEGELSPFGSPSASDQDYNPPYANDILLPIRKGWDSILHFITKHSDGLARATMQYVSSHLEFGGCLADYPGLRSRYAKIRGLEDVKEQASDPGQAGAVSPPRVRFVNYYTTSTGRITDLKSTPVSNQGGAERASRDAQGDGTVDQTETLSPRISVEEERDGKIITHLVDENGAVLEDVKDDTSALRDALTSVGISESSPTSNSAVPKSDTQVTLSSPSQQPDYMISLPPIPPPPQEPPFFIPSQYPTREARKLAEIEHAAHLKAYKQAVKEHNRAIKERTKILESSLKRKLRKPQSPVTAQPPAPAAIGTPTKPDISASSGKGRERRFCVLPPKINGKPDPTWIPVRMEGVDEVGAHCGLFFLSQTYEMLVGDVAGRIEDWVREGQGLR